MELLRHHKTASKRKVGYSRWYFFMFLLVQRISEKIMKTDECLAERLPFKSSEAPKKWLSIKLPASKEKVTIKNKSDGIMEIS